MCKIISLLFFSNDEKSASIAIRYFKNTINAENAAKSETFAEQRSSSGPGFVKATFENGMSVTKNVWAGVPKFNSLSPIGNQSGYNPNQSSYYYGEGNEGCNQIRLKALIVREIVMG